mmetsp:Transcript_16517/g.45267  ORF Transcript_16517/g.45267 Transcript_16517/m.45267 type:complete len:116 (+) Transcript_16517:1918-2265(+)
MKSRHRLKERNISRLASSTACQASRHASSPRETALRGSKPLPLKACLQQQGYLALCHSQALAHIHAAKQGHSHMQLSQDSHTHVRSQPLHELTLALTLVAADAHLCDRCMSSCMP